MNDGFCQFERGTRHLFSYQRSRWGSRVLAPRDPSDPATLPTAGGQGRAAADHRAEGKGLLSTPRTAADTGGGPVPPGLAEARIGAEPGLAPRASGRKERLDASTPRRLLPDPDLVL